MFITSNFRLKYSAFDLRFTTPWIYYRKNRYDITMSKTHTQAPQSTHQQDLFPDFPAKFMPKEIFRLITKSRETWLKSCPACWCQSYCGAWRVSVGLSLLFLTPSFLLTLSLFLSPTPHRRNCWRFRSLVATILTSGHHCPWRGPTCPPHCGIPMCEDLVLPGRTCVDFN